MKCFFSFLSSHLIHGSTVSSVGSFGIFCRSKAYLFFFNNRDLPQGRALCTTKCPGMNAVTVTVVLETSQALCGVSACNVSTLWRLRIGNSPVTKTETKGIFPYYFFVCFILFLREAWVARGDFKLFIYCRAITLKT